MNLEQAKQLVSSVSKTYESIADHFDLTRTKLWDEFQYFNPFFEKSQKVLEVGCGNGRNVKLFENLAVDYLGVDNSQSLIKLAQSKEFSGQTKPNFMFADILDLSRLPQDYDVVMLVAVLQHIPKPLQDQAMAQLAARLKNGGVLLMTNWNMWQKKFLRIRLGQLFKRILKPAEEIYGVPRKALSFNDVFVSYKKAVPDDQFARYLFAYAPISLKKLLEKHGFHIIKNVFTSGAKQVPWYKAKNVLTIARYNPNESQKS